MKNQIKQWWETSIEGWKVRKSSEQKTYKFTLNTAMTNKLGDFTEKSEIYPLKRLPNIKTFKIKLSELDPVLAKCGITKRAYPATLECEQYSNKKMNRYLEHQFIRLNKMRNNPNKFWKIAKWLWENSVSYRVYCLNHVYPGWYKKYTYGFIWKQLMKVEELMGNQPENHFTYNVTWIDEGTKLRPISSPTGEWRIILSGLQFILVVWLSPYMKSNQHGFKPKKGTMTAWQEILRRVKASENIYEYDFKKFFPSINLLWIKDTLEKVGTPEEISNWIHKINSTSPQNVGKVEDPVKWPNEECKNYAQYISDGETWNKTWTEGERTSTRFKEKEMIRNLKGEENPLKSKDWFGLPQGSAISPILSSFILDMTLLTNENIVQYADDGIIFDEENPKELLSFDPLTGITLSEEKSGWIKKQGVWLKPLKFLGKELIPPNISETGDFKLRGRTRKGSTLEMREDIKLAIENHYNEKSKSTLETTKQIILGSRELEISRLEEAPTNVYKRYKEGKYLIYEEYFSDWPYLLDELDKTWWTPTNWPGKAGTWQDWFATKYYGFITSRLYEGSWTIERVTEDFSLNFKNWSWSDLEDKRQKKVGIKRVINGEVLGQELNMNIYNISSFACRSLANRLRYERKKKAKKERKA